MSAISGPWVSESTVSGGPSDSDRGVAVIAVLSEAPSATPTRGMVAWVPCGHGACVTAQEAIDTGRLIAAAPALVEALREARLQIEYLHDRWGETGTGDMALARIATVLRKAGEAQ